jgi:hypothetical protein
MARFTFPAGLLAILLAMAALLAAAPAAAQFGSIFNQPPPRPPADVPGAASPDQSAPPPYYPSDRQPLPSERADEPPAEPLPAPMALPPQNRPGGGTIQEQELPPPPGTAPQQQTNQPPAVAQPNGAVRTLPGLPPGQRQPHGIPQPQQQQPTQQQPPAQGVPPPDTKEVVEPPPPERIANPTAVFEGLDKITGRTTKFDVAINETVQFGALQVTPRVCYSRPPTETPQTDSFVEVDEVTLKGTIRRIFTGWMFAASPGLNAVEHPIYDVWLTDCKGGKLPAMAEGPVLDDSTPKSAPNRPAPKAQRPLDRRGALPALR